MAVQKAKPVAREGRWETFEVADPNGTVVVVERNIDTGAQTVSEK